MAFWWNQYIQDEIKTYNAYETSQIDSCVTTVALQLFYTGCSPNLVSRMNKSLMYTQPFIQCDKCLFPNLVMQGLHYAVI